MYSTCTCARSIVGITSTSINIPVYMEGLFGVRLEGHPALHLLMDLDHPIPITSALASPQEADSETGVGGGVGVTLPQYMAMLFFPSVGLMTVHEEKV